MATEKLRQVDIGAAFKNFTKPLFLNDGGGLYLQVNSAKSASWVYRFKLNKRENRMGLGSYPDVSLAEARRLAVQARAKRAVGEDPLRARAELKRRGVTFEEATREYWKTHCQTLARPSNWMGAMEQHVLPVIGNKPVADLTPDDLIRMFKPLWGREITRKLSQWVNKVIVYVSVDDPRIDITLVDRAKNRLGPQKIEHEHHPAVPWRSMPALWKTLPNTLVGLSMQFLILSAVRVNCVSLATWDEIDSRNKVWTIPKERVKGWETGFRVPLTDPMIEALNRARRFRNETDYVFESKDSKSRTLSNNSHRLWLHEKGWKDDDGRLATAHGFRSSFRDWAAHASVDFMMAEHCVQHIKAKGGQTERAYFRTDLLEQRREVMERWADFVTGTTAEERRERRGDVLEAKIVIAHNKEERDGTDRHDVWEKLREDE